MQKIEDECVGCPPELGCRGEYCPNRNVTHWYCDKCRARIYEDEICHTDDGRELCLYCYNKWEDGEQ